MKILFVLLVLAIVTPATAQIKDTTVKTFYLVADVNFFSRLIWQLRNPSQVTNLESEQTANTIRQFMQPMQPAPITDSTNRKKKK